MSNSTHGLDRAWAIVTKTEAQTEAEKADLRRRRDEDMKFMILCASKGNMSMYHLLRDRSLDKEQS